MAPDDDPIELDPLRLKRRKEWEINRAAHERRKPPGEVTITDYGAIIFPECEALCHAAYVVAGKMADLPNAVEATREILEILAIPAIMRTGGDGRLRKIQRGPVRFGAEAESDSYDDDYRA